jgi:hypothetical protein
VEPVLSRRGEGETVTDRPQRFVEIRAAREELVVTESRYGSGESGPGAVHTFSNPGDEPVRFLNVMAPGGLERYLKEVAASMPADGPPDPAAMARIASRYDFEAAS